MPTPASSNRPSRWLLVAAVLVILVGLLFRFLGGGGESSETERVEVAVERAEPTPVVMESVVEETTVRREPALPFTPRATRVTPTEVADETAPPENLEDGISGEWRIVVSMHGAEKEIGRAMMRLIDDSRITVEAINGAGTLFPELRLDGYDVETSLVDAGAIGDFTGAFDPDFTKLTLSGTVREEGAGVEMKFTFLFFKIDDRYYEREELIAQHRSDLEQVVNAIKAYAADHGELPPDLDALVPDYLRDASAFASYDGRTVEYNPQARALPPAPEIPWHEIGDAASMIAYEQEMESYWGPELLDPLPVVSMSVKPLEVEFLGSTIYGVYQVSPVNAFDNYQGDDPAMNEARNAATRASCANNLKQLGLSAKMFQNEHPEERYPAGVFMLYPEFIADPRVLTCPSVEPGVLSYEFVYPAATDADLAAIDLQVTGNESLQREYMIRMPLMIETHLCAAEEGRNVLFVDGHVEFMVPERFEAEIAPFLRVDLR